MPSYQGWDTDPRKYKPEPGLEVEQDGTVLDVPKWRREVASRIESLEQVRSGQTYQRVYTPESDQLLRDLLTEVKKMNTQLAIITGEEL